MSYTEIYGFKKGKSDFTEEIKNAFRGAMAVWNIMDEKYLPPYYSSWDPTEKISRASAIFDKNAMKEIWALANNKDVPLDERLVMATTFDKVLVKRENLPRLIEAFRAFDKTYEGKSSIGEQADILESFLEVEDMDTVGWNQTSVNGDTWDNFGGLDEETEEYLPYDINTMEDHWFLFDDYKEELKTV